MRSKQILFGLALFVAGILTASVLTVNAQTGPQYSNSPAPAYGAIAITPSDSVNLTHVSRGVYVGSTAGGSTIVTVMADGTVVTRTNVSAGVEYPWQVKRINNTGTTASGLIDDY